MARDRRIFPDLALDQRQARNVRVAQLRLGLAEPPGNVIDNSGIDASLFHCVGKSMTERMDGSVPEVVREVRRGLHEWNEVLVEPVPGIIGLQQWREQLGEELLVSEAADRPDIVEKPEVLRLGRHRQDAI